MSANPCDEQPRDDVMIGLVALAHLIEHLGGSIAIQAAAIDTMQATHPGLSIVVAYPTSSNNRYVLSVANDNGETCDSGSDNSESE